MPTDKAVTKEIDYTITIIGPTRADYVSRVVVKYYDTAVFSGKSEFLWTGRAKARRFIRRHKRLLKKGISLGESKP